MKLARVPNSADQNFTRPCFHDIAASCGEKKHGKVSGALKYISPSWI